ncbi:MAG: bifunctional 4-hydroxy-2-oxoglutarate aldolase/2-dehydro-3-deoxy-phosphogluconate aldolase [Chloroflexi bacterium]|nr:bifunctional 4-hydroxy-2-oxoglutarate aldolase/2-dehydro-3-deoxy-phosphogluconate aldolase [Chloroflexota bacterium]
MSTTNRLDLIRTTGVIAIMRARSSDQLLHAADAIQSGGVQAIEVTMTTPGALAVIEKARTRHADREEEMLFGAGTVLDAESARAAILAGAQFIVAPTLDPALIELCRRYSVPVMPGAYTPTEILTAWEAGADMVKVFPASIGGPEFIRAIKAPLPQIDLAPVGGVEIDNTAEFIRAGATAVGVGSSLINQAILESHDFAALTSRARRFIEEVARGRAH